MNEDKITEFLANIEKKNQGKVEITTKHQQQELMEQYEEQEEGSEEFDQAEQAEAEEEDQHESV